MPIKTAGKRHGIYQMLGFRQAVCHRTDVCHAPKLRMNCKMPSFALRKTAFCSLKHGLSDGILPHIGNSLNARVERKDVNQDKHLQLWGASKAVCALPTPHGCLHALALMPTPYLYIRRIDRERAECMSLVLLAQQVVDSLDGIER